MNDIAIQVIQMSKNFKRIFDKPNTLKERLIFWNKSKSEVHHVLKNININIQHGETVALIGSNGSGKSTLLKLMSKILYPNQGSIITNGKLTSLLELGAGFHPDFTGRENIYFNAAIFGLSKKQIENRMEDIIAFSELGEFIDNPVRTYSSGMYMRLAFSVAINVDAEILLIDEILAVGDQHFQDKCFSKLVELRDSDKTIVIVSHSLDTVRRLCGRAIWLYNGEVAMDGDPADVIDHYLDKMIEDHDSSQTGPVEKVEGQIHFDEPLMNEIVVDVSEPLMVRGWALCNIANTTLKIYLDGMEIATAMRERRPDVLMTYHDMYGGAAPNAKCGWYCPVKLNNYTGLHSIDAILYNNFDQKIITQDRIQIKIEGNQVIS
ncbi:ATP-binding cassette domain-containing protein [Clostridiaceae bacterium DONG20-135]|uniref:ATP-binding cassette domain-containing protein n=1 Tax=Copranaerobaculum intestinale TaxID=2692629 RepID=A0A6N8U652_9FIRM|nr:ABC transporter ATP-binding protein [Copranaerobaculum intestinale]MXQ72985.1 ATP-binding cassette domain-containing protein [Copranaerobaculum intestinale]